MSSIPEVTVEVTEDPAHWINYDLNATGKLVLGFSVRLLGWAVRNVSSSTLATQDIYDGSDASGLVAIPLNLAANEVSVVWFGDRGVWFKNAVYVNVTAQEIKGSLFYRHVRI